MSDIPTLELAAFGPEPAPLARSGPYESWDFEPYIQGLLEDAALGETSDSSREAIRIVCLGRYSSSTPSLGFSRLTIGQLVARNASVELTLQPAQRLGRHSAAGQRSRLYVEFTLQTRSERDPSDITRRLGLEPSRQIRKGEMQANGIPSVSTRWTLSTSEVESEGFDQLLDEMLSLLSPHADVIESMTRNELDGVLSLVGHISDSPPVVRFSHNQLVQIRRLGLEVDVDLLT